jgi:hypothetical protein
LILIIEDRIRRVESLGKYHDHEMGHGARLTCPIARKSESAIRCWIKNSIPETHIFLQGRTSTESAYTTTEAMSEELWMELAGNVELGVFELLFGHHQILNLI